MAELILLGLEVSAILIVRGNLQRDALGNGQPEALQPVNLSRVVGHHPHVAQGYEKYNDSLIFYSLGNFIFDMENKETKNTFAVRIKIEGNSLSDFEIVPFEYSDITKESFEFVWKE